LKNINEPAIFVFPGLWSAWIAAWQSLAFENANYVCLQKPAPLARD
jgi:hypothetical protein